MEKLYKVWFTYYLDADNNQVPCISVTPFEVLSVEEDSYRISTFGYQSHIEKKRVNRLDAQVSWCTEGKIENFPNRMRVLNEELMQKQIDKYISKLEAVKQLKVDYRPLCREEL